MQTGRRGRAAHHHQGVTPRGRCDAESPPLSPLELAQGAGPAAIHERYQPGGHCGCESCGWLQWRRCRIRCSKRRAKLGSQSGEGRGHHKRLRLFDTIISSRHSGWPYSSNTKRRQHTHTLEWISPSVYSCIDCGEMHA